MPIRRSAKGSLVRMTVVPLVLCASLVAASCASADPGGGSAPSDDQQARAAAVADVSAQLGKPVRLDVKGLHSADGWAFVWATIRGSDGGPVNYAGTTFAEAAANGGVSKSYAGLLRDEAGQWRVVTSRVGPTDVAWETWSADYGAPKSIFVTD